LLTDFWRDLISIISTVGTLAGLVYAIVQIAKTKSAAQAARTAAKLAQAESHAAFHAYAAAMAHRFVNEIHLHVNGEKWEFAALRLRDLATKRPGLPRPIPHGRSWLKSFVSGRAPAPA
jgi:hypothetical protein